MNRWRDPDEIAKQFSRWNSEYGIDLISALMIKN